MRKLSFILLLLVFFTLIILFSQGFFKSNQEITENLIGRPGKTFGLLTNKNKNPQFPNQVIDFDGQRVLSGGVLVVRSVDGDTLEIEGGRKVRYIGINTPETSHPIKGVQCFGKQAAEKNKRLVEGKKVWLEKDVSETDKYGRLLRYVWIPSTSSGQVELVNEVLVKEGFAFSYPYPPDIKYQERFRKAEIEARKSNRGLWGQCDFIAGEKNIVAASGCLIKGNISSSGEKIYHLPGQKYYKQTVVSESEGERWFCTEEEVQKSGWRRSKL